MAPKGYTVRVVTVLLLLLVVVVALDLHIKWTVQKTHLRRRPVWSAHLFGAVDLHLSPTPPYIKVLLFVTWNKIEKRKITQCRHRMILHRHRPSEFFHQINSDCMYPRWKRKSSLIFNSMEKEQVGEFGNLIGLILFPILCVPDKPRYKADTCCLLFYY